MRGDRVDRDVEDELHPDVADDIVADRDRQRRPSKSAAIGGDALRARSVELADRRLADIGMEHPAGGEASGAVVGAAADDALAAERGAQRLDVADAVLQRQRETVAGRTFASVAAAALVALLSTRTIARSTGPIAAASVVAGRGTRISP